MKNSRGHIKQLGITIAFIGLFYLSYSQAELSQVPYLAELARYIPSKLSLCWHWFIFFLYLGVWSENNLGAKTIKAAFWSYWLSILSSYVVLARLEGTEINALVPLILNEVPRSGGALFGSWVSLGVFQVIFYFVVGAFYGIYPREPLPKEIFIRGKRLISLNEARTISENKVESDGPGVRFGWLTVPESQETTHFAVVGATGSGKTIIFRYLMETGFSRIGTGGDSRALIYDPKRDMLPILAGLGLKAEVITLHPFDKRGAAWDMAKDITSPALADQTATILIPPEKGSSNPFFTDAARALMTGVLTVFIRKCPDVWTFRDVIVALKSATRLKSVLLECEETHDLIEQYFSNEKTINDVMSTIATKIQRYQYIAAAWEKAERRVSLRDWIKNEYVLVLGNDEETRSAVDAINQVIFKRVTEIILNQSESFTRRTWILLDELKEAGELPGLASLLSKGRSKGACVVIGFQDIEGLSAAMKDTRLAHEVAGLCANKAILRLDSAETAKWASNQFGEQEIEQKKVSVGSGTSDRGGISKKTHSNSTSESWINIKRQAVMPAEFLDMSPVEKSGSLHGYYIIPSIGSYYAGIRMSGENSILSGLKPLDSETPGYLERDKEEQFLRVWDEADFERLGLSSLTSKDGFIKTQAFYDIEPAAEEEICPLELIKRL